MAASVRKQMLVTTAFEDYSVYSHLADEELIQLAIDRSLTESHIPSQFAHQFVHSPLAQTQSEPHRSLHTANVCELQREDTARRQAAVSVQDEGSTAPPSSDCCEKKGSQHCFSGDRDMILAFRNRNRDQSLDNKNKFVDVLSDLNFAIWKNDVTTVRAVVWTMSADHLSQPDSEGWIHLHIAAFAGSLDCLKVLVEAFPQFINNLNLKNQTPLILAVGRTHLSCAQCLLAAGADPNIVNKSGETALYKACEKANEELVELILKFGGNVSRCTAAGLTPLHEAVGRRNVTICKLLVDAGANIWARNAYGIEPLFTAAQIGAKEILSLFIRHGGNINTEVNDGATALYEASKNGHEEVVELLLSQRADANQKTKAGLTPLHVAAKNGHAGVVLLLLPRTNAAVVRHTGISPLHLAAEYNRDAILEILIEAGFDVNTQLSLDHSEMYEDRRSTALYFTVCNSNIDAASMLLEAGANPNLDVFNPLLIAAKKGNIDMASLLVEHGANVNASMLTQPTTFPGALLYCVKYRDMFKLLLDNGCDANSCFYCVYGNNIHPPIKSIHPSRTEMYRHDHDHEVPTTTTQFCEVMADPSYTPWAGSILDLLLDYVGHVKLCSRLIELLDSNKDWEYIKEKSRPPLSLIHLCRLRIRQLVGQQRLRQMASLPLPGRLIKYLFYNNEESEDFLYCGFD